MKRRYRIRQSSLWSILLIVGALFVVLGSRKDTDAEEITAPYTIDISEAYENPEKIASSDLMVDAYEKTKADTNERLIREIDSYSNLGTLKERTIYQELDELSKGIIRKNIQGGSIKRSVAADGTETLIQSSYYEYDDEGRILSESVVTADENGELDVSAFVKTEYTYTLDGQIGTAVTYVRGSAGFQRTSTITCVYNKSGVLTSASRMAAGRVDASMKMYYISNNQKKPVKVTTTDLNGNVLSVEEKGYYMTGNLAYSKIKDTKGNVAQKTYYYYDKDGYLERTLEYGQSDTGTLTLQSINIYQYFD